MPRIGRRDGDEFGPGARAINANALGIRVKVAPTGKTIPAVPASNMAFADDQIAFAKATHICSNRGDLADEFMADGHRHRNRFLRPGVPVVNVNIGAAD